MQANRVIMSLLAWALGVASAAAAPKIVQQAIATQELAGTAAYWTVERRASAKPRDLANRTTAGQSFQEVKEPRRYVSGAEAEAVEPTGAAEQSEETAASVQPLQDTTYPHPFTRYTIPKAWTTMSPYKAIGKLFMTFPGQGDFVCSASVIRAHLLITVGHCVLDGETWATNVVFYPGYYNGPNNTLGGAWFAGRLMTWSTSLLDYDIAFIQTRRKGDTACKPTATKKQIESFTGMLGFSYGGDYSELHFDAFGYPQAAPFNGKLLIQCEAGAGTLSPIFLTNTVEIGCDMTGGASGGPWLTKFEPGSTASSITSLNSFKLNDHPLAVAGPQFLSFNFKTLLDAAMVMQCP